MTAEEARSKALAVLRDGRLRILTVKTDAGGHLLFCDAIVYGHRGEHFVTFVGGTWQCSCPDSRTAPPCPHVFAAEMVCHGVMAPGRDGHPKAKPTRAPRPRTAGATS